MNNIKQVHLIGRMYGEVMHIDPNIELYKIEVYDEKKRSFETLKIGTQEECFFAMCSNEDIEISNFGYQEGVRSYYISGCFGGFFGVHKILHDPIRYFDKEDNNETT